MTEQERPVGEDDIQAFVDGRLPPARRGAVEDYLARNQPVARKVLAYVEQRVLLRRALRSKAEEPVPARLRVDRLLDARQRDRSRGWAMAASLTLAVVIGAGGGWLGRGAAEGAADGAGQVALAAGAHRVFVADARRPVEIRAEAEDQLVRWLSNRLGQEVHVPDLSAAGLRFLGGRLLPTPDGPAAQLMYEDGEGGPRVTLFLAPGSGSVAPRRDEPRFAAMHGVGTLSWADDRFLYTVAATADRARLAELGRAVLARGAPGGAAPVTRL